MQNPTLAFKTYRRTQHERDGLACFHGEYDGLQTGTWTHDHAQLLVPLKGRIQVSWADQTHLLGPERALALPAGTPHQASSLGGVFAFFALNAPAAWLPGDRPLLLAHPGVWHQARQLAAELDAPGPEHDRFIAAGLVQLQIYVARQPVTAPTAPGQVERAVALILAHYHEPLTVEGLAATLATSPRHLERLFQASLGMAPKRFLTDVRLAAARDLLVQTTLTVEAVAARAGFADAAQFARTFKAAVGQPPGAFRRLR